MKGRVEVFYKDSVFDPQGNTLAHALRSQGFRLVKDVRVGKVIDLELDAKSPDEAKHQLRKMADQLLANPVIESYKLEIVE